MGNFLEKIFGSKIEVDLVRINLEAKLCFHEARLDSFLSNAIFREDEDVLVKEDYTKYLQRVSVIPENCYWSLSKEIALLEEYIGFYRRVMKDKLFLKFDVKKEADKDIPAFLLFPLVTNALLDGYNSIEKFPLKIKIRVFQTALQLEVINHVNHHIVSQDHTIRIDRFKSRLFSCYADQPTLLFNSNSHTYKAYLQLPW